MIRLRLYFRVFSSKVYIFFLNLLIIKFANHSSGTLRKQSDEEDKLESLNGKEYYKDKTVEMSNNLSEMVADYLFKFVWEVNISAVLLVCCCKVPKIRHCVEISKTAFKNRLI